MEVINSMLEEMTTSSDQNDNMDRAAPWNAAALLAGPLPQAPTDSIVNN
jgi:hypothetical protein